MNTDMQHRVQQTNLKSHPLDDTFKKEEKDSAPLLLAIKPKKAHHAMTMSNKNLKRILKAPFMMASIPLLPLIIPYNTRKMNSGKNHLPPALDFSISKEIALNNLSTALKIPTVSFEDPKKIQKENFLQFHAYLEKNFPLAHQVMERVPIEEYSLLYRWKGKNPEKKPILFMAHMDVVPVQSGTEKEWKFPPFAGKIEEGFIWGRGTLDMKASLVAMMESIENLQKNGFAPEADLYLSFGHDEELGGGSGGKNIAQYLRDQKLNFEYILDEGYFITKGIVERLKDPVAMVGVAEKGCAIIQLTAHGKGGHGSMPSSDAAITILNGALHKLSHHPMPSKITPPVKAFLEAIAPKLPYHKKAAIANQWLLEPFIKNTLQKVPEGNALIRTTTAPTMLNGSEKANVLPERASAFIDFRPLPGEYTKDIIHHIQNTVQDSRVSIEVSFENNASKISDHRSQAFGNLEKTIKQTFPEVVVAPSIAVCGTDTEHYQDLSDNIFRFLPIPTNREDIRRVHNTNERIGVDDYMNMVKFYTQLIHNSNSPTL
jgi:carboxypeptidase PM20D1